MRYLKILGLAAIAATALMAFAGAGTATAETTLCTEPAGGMCLTNQTLRGTAIEGGGVSKPTLTAPFGNISCGSELEGKIERATTPSGNVAKLSWTNCVGGTAETVTLGKITIHHDVENNGTVTLENFVVKVVQAGIPCYYESGEIHGTFTAGADPKVDITAEPKVIDTEVHNSSAFCPASAPWHATYTLDVVGEPENPKPLYVVTGI